MPRLLQRLLRSAAVRVAIVVLVAPFLAAGPFGGITFFVHEHGQDGLFVHAGPTSAMMSGVTGCAAVGHDDAEHGGASAAAVGVEMPDGVRLSIPDGERLVARGVELPTAVKAVLKAAMTVECALAPCAAQPVAPVAISCGESPGGDPGGMDFGHDLSAGERLIRTSRALRI